MKNNHGGLSQYLGKQLLNSLDMQNIVFIGQLGQNK